ncbi:unnamed protein product [Pleuronectes platessa]|uniref:Uncharacterized protein n=1 Tax=Pleuronectes platessa TaxID=8262 RepID=A0A9N7VR74_PLEPL|nr:unnamed protein product [Pleuronectes platessa]
MDTEKKGRAEGLVGDGRVPPRLPLRHISPAFYPCTLDLRRAGRLSDILAHSITLPQPSHPSSQAFPSTRADITMEARRGLLICSQLQPCKREKTSNNLRPRENKLVTRLATAGSGEIIIATQHESEQFKGSDAWKCVRHPRSHWASDTCRVVGAERAWACLDQGLNFPSEDEEKVYGTLP